MKVIEEMTANASNFGDDEYVVRESDVQDIISMKIMDCWKSSREEVLEQIDNEILYGQIYSPSDVREYIEKLRNQNTTN